MLLESFLVEHFLAKGLHPSYITVQAMQWAQAPGDVDDYMVMNIQCHDYMVMKCALAL